MSGGYTGALAAMLALWHRRSTGQGQFVDLSQFEAVISVLGPTLLDSAANDRPAKPPGYESQEAPAAPHGVYRCAPRGDDPDRWIAISGHTQMEWERLIEVMEAPAWALNPKFRTLYLRIKNHTELDEHLSRWTIAQQAEELMGRLQRAKVPAGVVCNGADLCERHPQLQLRGFWAPVTLPDGSTTRVTGSPAKSSPALAAIRTPSPLIGSSNDYVLGEILGYSEEERASLLKANAVWA
jgi:benzylsuccinate CoA-transferase BbsF subunit